MEAVLGAFSATFPVAFLAVEAAEETFPAGSTVAFLAAEAPKETFPAALSDTVTAFLSEPEMGTAGMDDGEVEIPLLDEPERLADPVSIAPTGPVD